MDPLSIATGLTGLLGTAATVIKFLDTVKTTNKDVPKTVGWALAEVNDIHAVFASLQSLFKHIASIPKGARDFVTMQHAAVTLSEMVASFDELVEALKPLGLMDSPSSMRTWDRIKWSRKQDDIAQIITRIQVRKSSLALMLNIFQCESDVAAMKSRLVLENNMNTAIKNNIELQKRLGRMESHFEAFIDNAPAGKVFRGDDDSTTPSIKRVYTLADDASILSQYPIIDRAELRHPEFYPAPEPTREGRFLSSLVHRRRKSSDTRGSPQMSVSKKIGRTPANCGPDVMGDWSLATRRIWRATEFRFETQFEVPFIFVCRPSNKYGPVKDKPIHFVSGTNESLAATRALLPKEEENLRQSMGRDPRHTPDNERAPWLRLLSQLQSMERESGEWQRNQYRSGPRMRSPCVDFSNHTLSVAVQAEKRSWDGMPASIKKPYASTTICDLLEIAAMMGIHWKEFDRLKDRFRAEGNGYMLTGTRVPDLGVIFTFQMTGRNRFLENRVTPVDEIKELCCGVIPTLFREPDGVRRRSQDPVQDLSFLQLGSAREIASTMVLLGCNTDTANYFRYENTKHSHLFPVPFELVGMLGRTLHIRNSAFRMLPNPTPYRWDRQFVDLPGLVWEYSKMIAGSDSDLPRVPKLHQLKQDTDFLFQALKQDAKSKTPGYTIPLLNTLHDVLDRCDTFLQQNDQALVQIVVREHFQALLKLINERGEVTNRGSRGVVRQGRAAHFGDLTAASPELRPRVFMELYFSQVLGRVRERAGTAYARQQEMRSPSVSSPRRSPSSSPGSSLEPQAVAIWCTLVLRMMCWLLLHDFDKKDVQIPKSELLGSRLPVYIA